MGTHAESRCCQRFNFDWVAQLPDASPARVANMSSRGIYLVASRRFTEGERVECLIEFPPQLLGAGSRLALRCNARVLRVDNVEEDTWGFGCRIEACDLMLL